MRYELFLRRERALSDDELQQIRELVIRTPRLALDIYRRDAVPLGVDLGVETSLPQGARVLRNAAFMLAATLDLSVYDPQIGSMVSDAERSLVEQRLGETAAYAEGGALHAPSPAPSTRLWLYLGAGVVALLLLGRALTCAL